MGREIQTTYGRIDIMEEAIATLIGLATMECAGILGMVSRSKLTDGLSGILGRENVSKGVQVSVEDDRLTVDLFVIVAYGIRIPEVANTVITRVKYTVETMIGLTVEKITVNVQGVRMCKP